MIQPNNEILIDYLDNKLSPEEKTELESVIRQDKNIASELEYLKLTVETVRLNAITGKVAAVRQNLEVIPDQQISRKFSTVRSLYKTALKIAAILVVFFGSAVAYKYISVSSQSIYKNQFVPYDLSVTRGGEARDLEAEAYGNKNWSQVIELFNLQKIKLNKSYFLAAVAEMQLQHYTNAVDLFQHVLSNTTEDRSFQEEAEYYCALAYLMNHEELKGIAIINKIKSDTSHRYYPLVSKISDIDLKIINLKK